MTASRARQVIGARDHSLPQIERFLAQKDNKQLLEMLRAEANGVKV